MNLKYKRVLLKLSGESLSGKIGHGIDFDTVVKICEPIKKIVDMGCEVAIVVGGGNFWRGRSSGSMDRTRADHMGMLATVINALGRNRAVRHLEKGRVVVFGCGTGNPYFSTDTGAALRGAEIDAEVILKATMVDGVYDSDPKKNPNAKKYDHLTYMEILNQNLQVMDMTAASFCNDRGIPFLVFSIEDPENIVRAVCGENVGTVITKD